MCVCVCVFKQRDEVVQENSDDMREVNKYGGDITLIWIELFTSAKEVMLSGFSQNLLDGLQPNLVDGCCMSRERTHLCRVHRLESERKLYTRENHIHDCS